MLEQLLQVRLLFTGSLLSKERAPMNLEGFDPPTLEETFEEIEEERESLRRQNINLKVIIKRQQKQINELIPMLQNQNRTAVYVETLEQRLENLQRLYEEARSTKGDTDPRDDVGSGSTESDLEGSPE